MNLSYRSILILLLGFFVFCNPATGIAGDLFRNIEKTDWQKLSSDKDFSYRNDKERFKTFKPAEEKQNLLERMMSAFFEFWSSTAGNVILWILIIGAVGFVAYKMLTNSGSVLFSKTAEKITAGNADDELENRDWSQLLHEAVGKNDLRLAVRYSYMWMLQIMQERGFITYRNDKTNFEYYNELSDTPYKQVFRRLSRQYEYTWYGQYAISSAKYNEYIDAFNQLRKQLEA